MKNQIAGYVFMLLAAGAIVLSCIVKNLPVCELAKAAAILFMFIAMKYLAKTGLIN